MSVPGAKVSVVRARPEESEVELMYSTLSMPLSCCSMICVTEFSTVSAEAPVYCAPIVTRGGAMSGYCSSGRVNRDKAPASMVTMANTHAKMGRLIKNCAMVRAPYGWRSKAERRAAAAAWGSTAAAAGRCAGMV